MTAAAQVDDWSAAFSCQQFNVSELSRNNWRSPDGVGHYTRNPGTSPCKRSDGLDIAFDNQFRRLVKDRCMRMTRSVW